MSADGFKMTHALYMIVSGLIAILGLFAASRATDLGFAVFGFGLLLFGCAFGFWMLKRGLDAWERARHEA